MTPPRKTGGAQEILRQVSLCGITVMLEGGPGIACLVWV